MNSTSGWMVTYYIRSQHTIPTMMNSGRSMSNSEADDVLRELTLACVQAANKDDQALVDKLMKEIDDIRAQCPNSTL